MSVSISPLRAYFRSGATQPSEFRLLQLQRLKKSVLENEKQLYAALYADLKKTDEDAWATEVGFFLSELNHTIKHLKDWMEPKSVATNLVNMPSTSYTTQEPLGVVCICLLYTSPSPRDRTRSRMPSSA